eukprot:Gb_22885 [translate_table: standard]
MGRSACCSKDQGLNRGAWTAKEDMILSEYIKTHGHGGWKSLPRKAGLKRCGKSCRLRWLNYLRPDIKRGNISPEEEELIIKMHGLLGNRWSLIAGRLPGRTDNEIKNYWNTHLSKKLLLMSDELDHKTEKTVEDIHNSHAPAPPAIKKVNRDISASADHVVRTKAVRYSGLAVPDKHNLERPQPGSNCALVQSSDDACQFGNYSSISTILNALEDHSITEYDSQLIHFPALDTSESINMSSLKELSGSDQDCIFLLSPSMDSSIDFRIEDDYFIDSLLSHTGHSENICCMDENNNCNHDSEKVCSTATAEQLAMTETYENMLHLDEECLGTSSSDFGLLLESEETWQEDKNETEEYYRQIIADMIS